MSVVARSEACLLGGKTWVDAVHAFTSFEELLGGKFFFADIGVEDVQFTLLLGGWLSLDYEVRLDEVLDSPDSDS